MKAASIFLYVQCSGMIAVSLGLFKKDQRVAEMMFDVYVAVTVGALVFALLAVLIFPQLMPPRK